MMDEDGAFLALAPSLPLAGSWTLASFSDHVASLDLWPEPPEWDMARRLRQWAFESAALDLALAQTGRSLAEALGRESKPVRFVNSLGLGDPPSFATIGRRLGATQTCFKLDAQPSWPSSLIAEVWRQTLNVDVVDLRGHCGIEVETEAALLHATRGRPTLPDVTPRGPDPAGGDPAARAATARVSFDAPISGGSRHHDDDRQRQAVADRQRARVVGHLRPPRAGQVLHCIWRRHGRCATSRAARSSCWPRSSSRQHQRRGAVALQPARPAGGPADEPLVLGTPTPGFRWSFRRL